MDTFMVVDESSSKVLAIGLTKDDRGEMLEELSSNFLEARLALTLYVQLHRGEWGEFLVIIATDKISPTFADIDMWDKALKDFMQNVPPEECKTLKIGQFLNLN